MGLLVRVFKEVDSEYDCTNGGESSYSKGFTIINADGPFEPSDDFPAARIVTEMDGNILRLIPESVKDKKTCFGGNYAASSDSRFSQLCRSLLGHDFYGAIAIHDRVVTFDRF